MKYLVVSSDPPAPWREKVYENVFKHFGDEFHVVYCSQKEERRLWKFQLGKYPKTFLKPITFTRKDKERYINFGIIPFLLKNKPEIIVWCGYQPTVVLAVLFSKFIRSKLAAFSDTWIGRNKNISWFKKYARKIAYKYFSDVFIGASKQTLEMFKFFNKDINKDQLFLSWLCADNEYFNEYLNGKNVKNKYDIMFSGRIVDIKNPLFLAEVAMKVKEKLGSCRVLIIGDGDEKLKTAMFQIFEKYGIEYDFPGFIKHDELPEYYSQSKILLLPTSGDCWGVVLNEAMISGLPVITTNMTAAAGELVLDGVNGYVLPLDSEQWSEKIVSLLSDSEELHKFSEAARETVLRFNFEKAAQGIIQAIEYVKRK